MACAGYKNCTGIGVTAPICYKSASTSRRKLCAERSDLAARHPSEHGSIQDEELWQGIASVSAVPVYCCRVDDLRTVGWPAVGSQHRHSLSVRPGGIRRPIPAATNMTKTPGQPVTEATRTVTTTSDNPDALRNPKRSITRSVMRVKGATIRRATDPLIAMEASTIR